MFKSGYDEDLAREWVTISHIYRISLLVFQYYVGLYTHLWKVANTYSWRHAELQMEQHVEEMRQIRQYHGTRLQVGCIAYIYLRYQRDKGFSCYKIEDKMNKDIRLELETQGNLLETMRAEMETFKGAKSTAGGWGKSFKMVCFHFGMPGLHKGGKTFFSGMKSLRMKQEKRGWSLWLMLF
jgi:hypothetical protein